VRRLSSARFLFFRTLLVPSCRLSLTELIDRAEVVAAGLEALAARRGARFFRLPTHWYGVDPVHIRPTLWRAAWQELLTGERDPEAAGLGWGESLRLHALPPERRWRFGREQIAPQAGAAMARGGRVWIY
jgi:hypothetical protein